MREMMVAGVNVFRINFSHADYKGVETRIRLIRELNEELKYNVCVLADLQGPKLRVGKMKDGVIVEKGDRVVFTTKKIEEGTADHVYMNYQSFPADVKVGERILLDDGKLIFDIESTDKKSEVTALVVQGGPLKSNKGVNLPNTDVSLPALTEKDVEDAIFAIGQEVDWIALAVSDDAIPEFHSPLPNGVRTFHFSGSVACPAHGAVLWPIRAIQEDIPPDFDTLPCALQISAGHHDTAFEAFMRQTAPNCRLMNDEERMQAHIAAVFAANISNHAFAIAQDLAHAAGMPWETFAPLVQGVGQIATAGHSKSAQTGPALRRDAGTLERHRVWLKQHAPQWLPLYNAASASIQNHDTTPTP